MLYQISGGQFVNAQSGQVLTPEELEAELFMSRMVQQGSVGNMQIVGYMGETPVVQDPVSGQLVLAAPSSLARGPAAAAPRFNPAMLSTLLRRPLGSLPALTARPTGMTPSSLAPQLQQEQPGPIDLSPLSIDSQAQIAPGVTVLIQTVLQTIFRPERLSIGASVAPFFTITQLAMGNVPLTANLGELPAESFADDAVGANVRKVTGQPGQTLFVGIRNEDSNARRFRAAFYGASSQPEGCRV